MTGADTAVVIPSAGGPRLRTRSGLITKGYCELGVEDPEEVLNMSPEEMEGGRTTGFVHRSYAPESMWRGPTTPWGHNVLKLAKAMAATGFRQGRGTSSNAHPLPLPPGGAWPQNESDGK